MAKAPSAPGGIPETDTERGAWNSKLGFILASVGAAVGLGNLVLFPYRTATNGGASFVLIYIAMLFVVGIPALLAEMAIGRRFRRDPYGSYQQAGIAGAKARGRASLGKGAAWIGVLAIVTSVLLLSYYTVITGWALDYTLKAFSGTYFADPGSYFAGEVGQGPYTLLLHAIITAAVVVIVAPGVSQGIERAVTFMIPVLFVIVLGITGYGLFQSGAADGLAFYLSPDFSEISADSVLDAAGQTFFSIGIGFGLMVVYASYMDRESDIVKDSTLISFSDFGIALLGGLMIFPLVFTFGLEGQLSDSSVGMLFVVVPQAFEQMGALGPFLGFVFFLALVFAALSSAIALLEVCVATAVDNLGTTRWRAATLSGLVAYTVGIGSALSLDFLGVADALMANVFLILSGLALSIFAGWFLPELADDIDEGARIRVGGFVVWMLRLVVPLVLGITFLFALPGTLEAITGNAYGYSEAFFILALLLVPVQIALQVAALVSLYKTRLGTGIKIAWTAGILLTGLVGALVWFAVRPDDRGTDGVRATSA